MLSPESCWQREGPSRVSQARVAGVAPTGRPAGWSSLRLPGQRPDSEVDQCILVARSYRSDGHGELFKLKSLTGI
jgi:hypothetical protein